MKVRKLFLGILSVIFIACLLPVTVWAHPGDTDENGGHTVSDTGEYHYHHGYPAHDHYDMDSDGIPDCPYDFDDKSMQASNGSASSLTQASASPALGVLQDRSKSCWELCLMDYFIIVTCLLIISYLLYTILRANPFDRVLFHREYNIKISDVFIDTIGWLKTSEIEFTRHAVSGSLRKAVFDCRFSNPQVSCIKFKNLLSFNYISNSISDFQFACIDFSSVDYVGGDFSHKYFPFVSDEFNCARLVLPNNISCVELVCHCPALHSLVIPCNAFVPVLWEGAPYDDPILVQADFHIEVPRSLIAVYQADPQWGHVRFCDIEGNEFSPKFVPKRS